MGPEPTAAMHDFAYLRARDAGEAVRMLRGDPGARPMAGGQTLIPILKQRLAAPTAIVDLGAARLSGIRAEGGVLRIGAMTTHAAIAADPEVAEHVPALAKLASWIGDPQVRARGTIGGSLANNDPAACHPAAALALAARIRTDRRTIAADAYFQGFYTTALDPDEIIVEIEVDAPQLCGYSKFRHPASRFAMVGVFAARGPAGVRIAVTGAYRSGVGRHGEMEAALAGRWSPESLEAVVTPPDEMNEDIHASAAYRSRLVDIVAKRAVATARGGGSDATQDH